VARVRVRLAPRGAPVKPFVVAVVVDVLRASTTLAFARAHGALRVLPAATPEEARAIHAREPGSLLCGELDVRIIPGFHLGNSPAVYSADAVRGRTLVFASTNGSIALALARTARRRVLGAFVNASAVVDAVAAESEVEIVCSGKLGEPSLEDAGAAGWLCRMLERRGARLEGAAARCVTHLAPDDATGVRSLLEGCSHGRYLRRLGPEYRRDLDWCARVDELDRADAV
jgi:2-phosphosulfolactate phosphatase